MNPTLFEGNIICIKHYKKLELKQGNIIHYVNSDGMDSLHRIAAIQPDILIVQGDNNNDQEIINYSQVKGIVVAVIYS